MKQCDKKGNLPMSKSIVKISKAVAIAVFAMAVFISCGRSKASGNFDGGYSGNSMARNMKMASPRMMASAQMPMPMAEEAVADDASLEYGASEGIADNMLDGGRKLVHTASITIEVSDLDAAEEAVMKEVSLLKGYAANTNRSDTMLSVDMKVPSARFSEAVNDVSGMGHLIDKNVNAQDVTDRYYDLDSRIRTKQILKERLESYLKESANMKDLVAVETQLNSVISDLESMQGQFKRLSNQIEYSSISVRFALPKGKTERGWRWPSVSGKARGFVVGAAGFFTTLLLVILGIVLFGTPVVLLAALLYCLTFGKVGWVRRLFKKMKE